MHARLILDADTQRPCIRLRWTAAELLALTARQHRVFGQLLTLQARTHGQLSLLEPGIAQALYDLAARPWWRAATAPLQDETPDPIPAPPPQ
jgi:hypothetical protein